MTRQNDSGMQSATSCVAEATSHAIRQQTPAARMTLAKMETGQKNLIASSATIASNLPASTKTHPNTETKITNPNKVAANQAPHLRITATNFPLNFQIAQAKLRNPFDTGGK